MERNISESGGYASSARVYELEPIIRCLSANHVSELSKIEKPTPADFIFAHNLIPPVDFTFSDSDEPIINQICESINLLLFYIYPEERGLLNEKLVNKTIVLSYLASISDNVGALANPNSMTCKLGGVHIRDTRESTQRWLRTLGLYEVDQVLNAFSLLPTPLTSSEGRMNYEESYIRRIIKNILPKRRVNTSSKPDEKEMLVDEAAQVPEFNVR
ncbi:MAG: hypothetical protein MRY79_03450 [Alphaproteobacteria bacterium]|nr:hypothetical protein [Alphaproteobacteria bacterium]